MDAVLDATTLADLCHDARAVRELLPLMPQTAASGKD
jgi:hypothetical protein